MIRHMKNMIRVVPVIEFLDSSAEEPVEGGSFKVYGRTKPHPDRSRRSQVFPHPDLVPEATVQKWLDEWDKARVDVFALQRRFTPIAVDFICQRHDGEKWVTIPRTFEFGTETPADAPAPVATPAPAPTLKRKPGRPRKALQTA